MGPNSGKWKVKVEEEEIAVYSHWVEGEWQQVTVLNCKVFIDESDPVGY